MCRDEYRLPIFIAAHESTNARKLWYTDGKLRRLPIWTTIPGTLLSSASGIGRVMRLLTLNILPMGVNMLLWWFYEWKVKLSGNTSVSRLIRLDTSDDSSFFFQSWVLSILHLVVVRTDGLPGGFTGIADEVKGGSLSEFNGAGVEGSSWLMLCGF